MMFLFAPWRKKYVKKKKPSRRKTCFLCDYAVNYDKDEENYVLYRGEYSYVVLNRYPYNEAHLMIVPYRHVTQIEDLSNEEWMDIIELMRKSIIAIKEAYSPDGFNIGINIGKSAGAGEEHLHIHIVPRWAGDTNFMTTVEKTRVIPDDLRSVYKTLKPLFEQTQ